MAQAFLFSDPADVAAINSLVSAPAPAVSTAKAGTLIPTGGAQTYLVMGLIAAGVLLIAIPEGRGRR